MIVCMLMPVMLLTACGSKVPELTSDNRIEVELWNFRMGIYDSYQKAEDQPNDEYLRYYKKDEGETILMIRTSSSNNASHLANVDFLCDNLAGSYGIESSSIQREEIGSDRYYLSWTYVKEGTAFNNGACVVFAGDSQISVTEGSMSLDLDTIRTEVTRMAETAEYTGTFKAIEKDYVIETSDYRIHVGADYDSPQRMEDRLDDQGVYRFESEFVSVFYKAAPTVDRGNSYFKISCLKDEREIAAIAKERADSLNNEEVDRDYSELRLGDIWTECKDADLASVRVYRLISRIKDNPYYSEAFYFEKGGKKYVITVFYPEKDETARNDMLKQFYMVELI